MTTKSEMEQDKPDENVSTAAGAKRKAIKFRKAPQAPKRGKSAFILFSMAKHPEFRKKLADGADDKVKHLWKLLIKGWCSCVNHFSVLSLRSPTLPKKFRRRGRT